MINSTLQKNIYALEESPKIMPLKFYAWPWLFLTVSFLICQIFFFSQPTYTWPPKPNTIMPNSICIISLKVSTPILSFNFLRLSSSAKDLTDHAKLQQVSPLLFLTHTFSWISQNFLSVLLIWLHKMCSLIISLFLPVLGAIFYLPKGH